MKTMVYRIAAAGLLALLGSGAGAWALPGDGKEKEEKKIEKRRIVIVSPDGEERVIEGAGPMVRRGYLGVGLTEMTPELRTHFGAPEAAGVMVSRVEPGSPADKAGLEVGDVVARIDGKDVKSSWDVRSKARGFEEGQQVPVEVWRDGKAQTLMVTVTLRERPEMDMGPLFLRQGDGEDGPVVLRLNGELGGLPERFDLPAPGEGGGDMHWVQRDRSPRERQLEKRLQELEKRIADLEKQLTKKGS